MENRGWKVSHDKWGFALKKNLPNNTRVCALIDEENGKWIEDRVLGEFIPHEAVAIPRLPLSSTHAEHRLIWLAMRNGCYSTKLAYQPLSTEAAAKTPGPSNTSVHK